MPLSPDDRAALIQLLHELGPTGQREVFVRMARRAGHHALEELGRLPGLDQLRAGLLRALDDLVEDEAERQAALHAAHVALSSFPAMAREEDPMLVLARHPAWVGLAVLELSERQGDAPDLDRAVRLASTGFTQLGKVGVGEMLWAMAEQAEEAGWTDRAATLLQAATTAEFDEEHHRGEVRLLLGLRHAEDGDPRAQETLEQVAAATGPSQRRVHALWVLSALNREQTPQQAIRYLSEALVLLREDPEADPAIVQRVADALTALGAPTAGTA